MQLPLAHAASRREECGSTRNAHTHRMEKSNGLILRVNLGTLHLIRAS